MLKYIVCNITQISYQWNSIQIIQFITYTSHVDFWMSDLHVYKYFIINLLLL